MGFVTCAVEQLIRVEFQRDQINLMREIVVCVTKATISAGEPFVLSAPDQHGDCLAVPCQLDRFAAQSSSRILSNRAEDVWSDQVVLRWTSLTSPA